FDTTFDYAVLRAAQLQYDTDFPGPAVAFSWPSAGAVSDYKGDVGRALQSTAALGDVIDFLSSGPRSPSLGKARLHVIAHSLGNRVLLEALHGLVERGTWKSGEKHLGQVVLAAPDVGAARFNNLLTFALGAAERVTYYYCRTDGALAASQQMNFYEPVGLYPYFENGLDTINADGVGTDFMRHSYYGSSAQVLSDLHLLICERYTPDRRMPPLTTHSRLYGHDHWSFLPVTIREE
ncbi:MAG TPA: alpha/beta hydrolase, partial [Pirellulales bacterium]|nr:alpha/beta hydrolase [Pirellulales bacterium]